MERIDGALVLSPSDLHHFLECEYLTQLEIEVANGRVLEERRRPEADLLAVKGEAHERAQLTQLRVHPANVVEIANPWDHGGWIEAGRATCDAMRCGADVIYQAVLIRDGWRGRADFLVKSDMHSALGAWSYEVWDTKLARHARPSHVLQLAYYTEQVAAIQGIEPTWMHVILGTGECVRFRARDFMADYHSVRARFLRAVERSEAVSPYPVTHCALCGYAAHCEERWEAEDSLSLVASIRRSQVDRYSGERP